jgi:threonine dehydratase
MRGAYNKIASLSLDERARGVVTYSSGNHAQAVARAARMLGAHAVICMPRSAPRVKIEGVRRDGAEIVFTGPDSEERHQRALELVEQRWLIMVEPYDDPEIIAGQGTCGLEIVEDLPDVATVLVPVSGGGLSAGVATAVKALAPSARIIGVEPELAADGRASLTAKAVVPWTDEERYRTRADGLRTPLSDLTFAHLSARLDGIVTVTEDEIAAATTALIRGTRLVVEPSGAVATAARLFHSGELPSGRTVAVISGGNLDPAVLAALVAV